jgi:hypothetical protein
MRTIVLCAAVLTSACGSSSKPQPASAATAASPPTPAPPVATSPADSTAKPVFSPDGSVRRAKPEEISTGRAPLRNECEGEACGVVTVTWLDPGYRFQNTSAREVAIKIWFVSTEDCVRQEIAIGPGKNSGWGNVGFCRPYHVSYKLAKP